MPRRKRRKQKPRKTHMETLKELIQEQGGDGKPAHKVLRDMVQERRAEILLLKELRSAVNKWRKKPSKLPRDEVARRWARLLKM